MAALIQSLYFAGSRLSTGAPNDTGTVYAYVPGTVSPATLYADADASVAITQPITLDAGGRIPYSTYPDGVWITSPVRLFVQDVDGNTVSDAPFWPADARDTALSNSGFTGDTVDEALSALYASTGGQDGKYKESGGATARDISDKFREFGVSPEDFGAVGNGIAIDTVPMQTAINRAITLGCRFNMAAKTYLIDQALTVTSGTKLVVAGAGIRATLIKTTSGTANCFTVSGSSGITFQDFEMASVSGSSGTAIATTTSTNVRLSRVAVNEFAGLSAWATGVSLHTATGSYIADCFIEGSTQGASITNTTDLVIVGGLIQGTTYGILWDGTTTNVRMFGVRGATVGFNGPMRWAATSTGNNFWFYGCTVSSYSIARADLPAIKQFAGTPVNTSIAQATGTTMTPTLYAGQEILLHANAGGAGTVTVDPPALLPVAVEGQYWDFAFKNAAGGAVTWTLNAVYVVSAAIPVTAAHTIYVRFYWDSTTSKLREKFRADTVT